MKKRSIDPAKIQRNIGKLIADKVGVPVLLIDETKVKELFDIIKKDNELLKHYSETELYQEVSRFYTNLMVIPPKSDNQLKKRIAEFENRLKTEKNYTAIILLEGVYDLPIGIKLGKLKIIKQDIRKKSLKEHLKYLEEKDKVKIDRCSWGKIQFKSYRSEKIREILYQELEIPFSVLTLILNRHIDTKYMAGIIYSDNKRAYLLEPSIKFNGWTAFNKKVFGKYLHELSVITQKNKPTPLEEKMLRSLPIYWLSQFSQKYEIQFLLMISATESLLLTENDRDYLGLKIAEKAAFLLSEKGDKRLEIYKLMKKYYSKRSKIIHGGIKDVSREDVMNMENIYMNLMLKLLDLTNKYSKMEQKSNDQDSEGIEDLILKEKFYKN